ncbi:MAG: hypothetical protein AAF481_09425 [Acidobacteriota bacterium]
MISAKPCFRWLAMGLLVAPWAGGISLPGAAQSLDLAWELAPLYGGDVRTLAVDPRDPETLFAGTSAGHIYRSTDGGESWVERGHSTPLAGWVVGDLMFDPNRPDRLWAALWGVWGGGTVVYTEDGGRSWVERRQGLPGGQVYTLALLADQPGRLYAGTRQGVFGSDDDGESWRHLTAELPRIQKVTSLMVDARYPERITAGTWRRAYRSDDRGTTWRGVFEGMALDSEVFRLQPVPGSPDEVWASTCGWVYRSLDGGERWKRYKEGLEWRRTPSFSPLPGGALLAGTVGGLYRSDDGGASWHRVSIAGLVIQDIVYHRQRPQRIWLATEGAGVWRSDDGGRSFAATATGLTNLRIGALAATGEHLLVAVNHAGPFSGVYQVDSAVTVGSTVHRDLPPILDLAVAGPNLLAATEAGLFERSGTAWRQVTEVGKGRVEELATSAGRVAARTPGGVFEQVGAGGSGLFERLALPAQGVRSLTFAGADLWISHGEGLVRRTAGATERYSGPYAGGRIASAGSLLFAGDQGLWRRQDLSSPWVLLEKAASKIFATGGERFSALAVGEEGAWVWDREATALRPVELPVRAADITAARVFEGRLFLGTVSRGLWLAPLAGDGLAGEPSPRL